jgi:hypothetical protein
LWKFSSWREKWGEWGNRASETDRLVNYTSKNKWTIWSGFRISRATCLILSWKEKSSRKFVSQFSFPFPLSANNKLLAR